MQPKPQKPVKTINLFPVALDLIPVLLIHLFSDFRFSSDFQVLPDTISVILDPDPVLSVPIPHQFRSKMTSKFVPRITLEEY